MVHDSIIEFVPTRTIPDHFTVFQVWENIDHPSCHGFKTGPVEGERRSVDIQTQDCTPWEQA